MKPIQEASKEWKAIRKMLLEDRKTAAEVQYIRYNARKTIGDVWYYFYNGVNQKAISLQPQTRGYSTTKDMHAGMSHGRFRSLMMNIAKYTIAKQLISLAGDPVAKTKFYGRMEGYVSLILYRLARFMYLVLNNTPERSAEYGQAIRQIIDDPVGGLMDEYQMKIVMPPHLMHLARNHGISGIRMEW